VHRQSRRVAGLLSSDDTPNLGREFANPIGSNAETNLSYDTSISFGNQISFFGLPGASRDRCGKCPAVESKLRLQGFLRPAIGDEVSREGMTRPPPES
jgi:hypothetical protein